ncbi:MAG: hypothetical protein AAB221_00230, partial [Bacteroidota bacterium]
MKFHVKVVDSGGAQLVSPSFTLPPPAAVNVKMLSFLQASKGGAWFDTSVPFAVALLNFQVLCVRSSVFVFGGGGSSVLLQEEKMKKFAAI